MATQPAAGARPTPTESIDAIFGPARVVVGELTGTSQRIIYEKASSAPRTVNIMRHDTAEQLNNWAAGSLWRYAGDRIIATVSTNVVVPSPTGGAEIAFVLEQGSGAQAAIYCPGAPGRHYTSPVGHGRCAERNESPDCGGSAGEA